MYLQVLGLYSFHCEPKFLLMYQQKSQRIDRLKIFSPYFIFFYVISLSILGEYCFKWQYFWTEYLTNSKVKYRLCMWVELLGSTHPQVYVLSSKNVKSLWKSGFHSDACEKECLLLFLTNLTQSELKRDWCCMQQFKSAYRQYFLR